MAKCSIETKLLKGSIYNTNDYSALSVYSLLNVNLSSIIAAQKYVAYPEKKILLFDIDGLTWSDYSKITSVQWLEGIQLATTNNKLIKALFSLCNLRFSSKSDCIIVSYDCSPDFVLSVLQIVQLAPYHNHKTVYSGNYKLLHNINQLKLIRNNENISSDPMELELIWMHTPDEHIEAFNNDSIDMTSFTSLPIAYIKDKNRNGHYYNSETSLIGSFQLSKRFLSKLSFQQYDRLADVIYGAKFTVSNHDYWVEINDWLGKRYYKQSINNSVNIFNKHKSIDIVYDDFYPNKLVCQEMKQVLVEHLGLESRLIQDDYYNPSLPFDIRFNINHFFKRDCPLLRYAIVGMAENLSWKTLGEVSLARCANDILGIESFKAARFSHLPRFKIIGHYLSRIGQNPLIKSCSELHY